MPYKMENDYARIVDRVLKYGEVKRGRNGKTKSLFGQTLDFDMSDSLYFPILLGRKMYYKGILGEFAAFLNGPKHINDFEKHGCNYWRKWAKEDGSINVDYGNLWTKWGDVNQLEQLVETLKKNPNDRRMLISSWKPDTMADLDLPCCHYAYQWYVRDKQYLDMLWHQRSTDTMIGLPSDIILAAVFNILLANNVKLKPGRIKMTLGDTHIYEEHFANARTYVTRVAFNIYKLPPPYYKLRLKPGAPIMSFLPGDITVEQYKPLEPLDFLLKE